MTLALIALFLAGAAVHFGTGTSPLIWLARALLIVEAARRQAWAELILAAVRWWRRLPRAIEQVQEEAIR